MNQNHETNIHQHKISRAFWGDDILRLPVDKMLVSRCYATYDSKHFKPARGVFPQQKRAPEQGSTGKDNAVVIQALQRILRGKEDKPNKSFSEFGQARPIR